jgi:hypothetical protein
MRPQALVGAGELFGQDPCFRQGGNEVRVSRPPGQDMHVQVVIDSGTGSPADVESEVETIRVILALQRRFTSLSHLEKSVELAFFGAAKRWNVPVGNDQEVSDRIGEQVQDDKQCRPTKEDEIGLILFFPLGKDPAEDTASVGRIDAADIVKAPRRPQAVHWMPTGSLRC